MRVAGGWGGSEADGYGAANPGCSHLTHSRGTFTSMVIRPASVSIRKRSQREAAAGSAAAGP